MKRKLFANLVGAAVETTLNRSDTLDQFHTLGYQPENRDEPHTGEFGLDVGSGKNTDRYCRLSKHWREKRRR